jgi:tetratricopeptide (TPR) repeat protein
MFCARSLHIPKHPIAVWAFLFLFQSAFAAEIPPEVLGLQEAAQKDIQEKNFDGAREKYQAIIRKYPDSEFTATARGKMVELCLETGRKDQAEAALEEMMAHGDASAAFKEALHGVGRAYRWKAGDPARGRAIYTRWLETFADDPDSHKMQCAVVKSWLEEKNIEGARQAMERFKELCRGKDDVTPEVKHLADVFQGNGYPEDAIQTYQWFIDACPHPAQVNAMYVTLIETHLRQKNKDRADAVVEKLLTRKDADTVFREAIMGAGQAYRWLGQDPAGGREIYHRWLNKFSDAPEAYKFQCAVVKSWIEEKNVEEAEKALERFKELCKGKADVTHEVKHLAGVFRDQGRPDTSLALYRWFLDTFTRSEQVNSMYAAMIDHHLRLSERVQADAALEQLMERSDKSEAFKEILHEVGRAYRWTAKDPAKGQEIYNRWVEKFSSDPEAFKLQCSVVLSLLEANDMEGAGKALERFKQLCEGQADVFREMAYLGLNCRNRGQFDMSLELYRWYVGLSPGHLDRFLEVYSSVQGFKAEVNDALDKSSRSGAKGDFMDQLIGWAGRSRDPARVISFYAERCGGQVEENTFRAFLQLVEDDLNPPIGLSRIMDIFNRQKMASVSVQLCQAFLAEHPKSERRPILLLKLYESMLASGTEAAAVISHLDDYLKDEVPGDSELAGKAITLKGQAYIQLAESAQAIACFKKVIEEYPQYPSTSQAMFFLGYCYLMQNDFEQARQTLESLVAKYPGCDYEVQARSLLERIAEMT